MKMLKNYLLLFLFVLGGTVNIVAQEEAKEEERKAKFITVTTMHWNMDQEDFNMDEWKATEKEYLDKVVSKNDHIMGASFYMHQFTEDNTELLYVQVFSSWNDIHDAGDRSGELAAEAWPDEDARKAFFEKRMNYYSIEHSDEIYATMEGAKPLAERPEKDMTLYLRRSHFAFPEDGTMEEWQELRNAYLENVVHKNEYVKGYYPHQHYYGADRTEYAEAFYVDSLSDLDKMLDNMGTLAKEAWPDDEKRKEMGEKMSKYYSGKHGDFIYTYIAGLTK